MRVNFVEGETKFAKTNNHGRIFANETNIVERFSFDASIRDGTNLLKQIWVCIHAANTEANLFICIHLLHLFDREPY